MKKNSLLLLFPAFLLITGCTTSSNENKQCSHYDANRDHRCDTCGVETSVHEDSDNNHKCDFCGQILTGHRDTNSDGSCDMCGINIPLPKEEEKNTIDYKYENLGSFDEYSDISGGGSYSDWFDEVNAGRFLAENNTYSFNFTSNYTADSSFTVVSLFENHATVRRDELTESKFYLDTHTAGDTVLIITNALGDIVYRKVVRIRPSYTPETILNVMYLADYYRTYREYENYTGKWVFSMLENTPEAPSVVSGSDDYDEATCSFNLEYDSFSEFNDLYYFICKDSVNSSPYTNVSTVAVSRTGDAMYLYYLSGTEEHLLSILYNIDIDYVYSK